MFFNTKLQLWGWFLEPLMLVQFFFQLIWFEISNLKFNLYFQPICKLQILQLCISRTRSAFDLKFSPVTGIYNIRLCAKFQFSHLSGWRFMYRLVCKFLSSCWYGAILSDLEVQSTENFHQKLQSLNKLGLQKFRFLTWLERIL